MERKLNISVILYFIQCNLHDFENFTHNFVVFLFVFISF